MIFRRIKYLAAKPEPTFTHPPIQNYKSKWMSWRPLKKNEGGWQSTKAG
jgi:hypothetical protein